MIQRALALLVFLAMPLASIYAESLAEPSAPGASAPASPTFELADVHVSPKSTNTNFTGGVLHGDRYLLHNATMVDMLSLAYGMDDDNILSGPPWLGLNRYDINARAPRTTSPDDLKLMLQALLADRFHLVAHKDTHPMPAFVLSVGKGSPKLKAGDDGGPSDCDETPNHPSTPQGSVAYNYVTCTNMSLDRIASNLHGMAGAYLDRPVVNTTGIKGVWTFDIKWTSRGALQRAGSDGITIFDAVDKQLGLKLEAKTAPLPVVVVDKVDETPTANPPEVEKSLPPLPPAEFDVAVLTPSKPDAQTSANFNGTQVKATGLTIKLLIAFAWNLNENDDDLIADGPKWLGQDHWDLVAKAAPEAQSIGPDGKPQFDFDLLPHMVQTLLAERFQLKSHMEDRTIDAFTLVAAGPKMKKTADPMSRTGCREGPGPDGKDPRIADPILGRLVYCQNMTMAQLADQLPDLAGGYVFTPVLDSTGLKDAYDFTLSFSTAGQLGSKPPPQPGSDPNASSDPNGGLSLPDAMARQLGVKMVKEKRKSPVLVIDHIEEKPTEN